MSQRLAVTDKPRVPLFLTAGLIGTDTVTLVTGGGCVILICAPIE